MARHKRHDRPTKKVIAFRESLVEQVEASLRDPLTGKPGFAAWSSLLTLLLEGWLDGKFVVPQFEPFRIDLKELISEDEA